MFPIKINFDTTAVDMIVALDHGHGEMRKRQIWFADDSMSDELTSLTNAGVIFRLRSGVGAESMTVKLRPCRFGSARWTAGLQQLCGQSLVVRRPR